MIFIRVQSVPCGSGCWRESWSLACGSNQPHYPGWCWLAALGHPDTFIRGEVLVAVLGLGPNMSLPLILLPTRQPGSVDTSDAGSMSSMA